MPGVAGEASISQEAWRGLVCGVAFGATSPLAAHPLDVIKSKMHVFTTSGGALATLRSTLAVGGVRALYRGLLPPLVGSVAYRSLQFSVYGAVYSASSELPALASPVDALGGLQWRVVIAGLAASLARALIETPLEVAKVRRQLGVPVLQRDFAGAGIGFAALRAAAIDLSTGFGLTFARLSVALGGFFVLIDTADRHFPGAFTTPIFGPFAKGALCATLPWVLAWPLEVAKNQLQSGLHDGSGLARLAAVIKQRSVFRGIGPGLARSLVGNGAALLALDACQRIL